MPSSNIYIPADYSGRIDGTRAVNGSFSPPISSNLDNLPWDFWRFRSAGFKKPDKLRLIKKSYQQFIEINETKCGLSYLDWDI